MNGHIAHTGGGGKDKRKIGGLQKAKKRMEAVCLDNFELVFLYAGNLVLGKHKGGRRKHGPSLARFRNASAAWHCTFKLVLSMS
jgi:hypothetical protein